MTVSATSLEQQVKACRTLLALCQQERQQIQQDAASPLAIVRQSLPQKQALLSTLGQAAASLSQPSASPGDAHRCQGLIGELTGLLEQLLVIDQENERTVRQQLQRRQAAGPAAAPAARRGGARLLACGYPAAGRTSRSANPCR